MRVAFDTETSGLVRPDIASDHASQPDLVQLGVKLYDAQWRVTGKATFLIRPDGWSIEPEAEAHHGISEARCARHGVPLVAALAALQALCSNARQIIGHHVDFDRRIIRRAIERAGGQGIWWEKRAADFVCTMEASTPILQLPGQYGSFKFPSLEEAHRHFFPGEDFVTQHDAESDLDATVRIFRELQALGAVPEPMLGRR